MLPTKTIHYGQIEAAWIGEWIPRVGDAIFTDQLGHGFISYVVSSVQHRVYADRVDLHILCDETPVAIRYTDRELAKMSGE